MSDAGNGQREWRFYIHAYLGIDDDTVWSIIRDDIPALLIALDRCQRELR